MPGLLGLLGLFAAGLVIYWAVLVLWVGHRLTRPPRRSYAWAVAYGQPGDPGELTPSRPFESWAIPDPRDRARALAGWTIPGDAPDGPMVVFTHGWGESKQAVLTRLDALAAVASRVVAWDLPGHGESTAPRSALGADESMALAEVVSMALGEDRAALEAEVERIERDHDDDADWDAVFDRPAPEGARGVVLAGFSLGAGVSIQAATEIGARVAAVIAEAPYRVPWTPAAVVLRMLGVPPAMVLRPALVLVGLRVSCGPRWTGFDRAQRARTLRCPLLVLHGSDDRMCPPDDGRQIAAAAERGLFVEIHGAAHMDLWAFARTRREAAAAIHAFVRSLQAPPAQPRGP